MRLNLERLQESGMYDPEFIRDLIHLLIADGQERVQRIQTAYDQADWPTTAREAHSLKGALLNVGAEDLAALCERVDAAVRQLNAAPESKDIESILSEFNALTTLLQETAETIRP